MLQLPDLRGCPLSHSVVVYQLLALDGCDGPLLRRHRIPRPLLHLLVQQLQLKVLSLCFQAYLIALLVGDSLELLLLALVNNELFSLELLNVLCLLVVTQVLA